MSKVALICDTHAGIRGDSKFFLDSAKSFYDDVFFPTLQKESVEKVIHLGDLFDRPRKTKSINLQTVYRLHQDFLKPLNDLAIPTHFLVGNHDTIYKNTNIPNAVSETLKSYNNFRVHDQAREISIAGVTTLLLPWICKDNYEHSIDLIKYSNAAIVFGHLQINGFETHVGKVYQGESLGDLKASIFNKYDMVFSGHFHHPSKHDNIRYLGASQEYTWADFNDPRGFSILDLDTRKVQFYSNPYTMFTAFEYNEDKDVEIDLESTRHKYVKILASKNDNQTKFDSFIESVKQHNPIQVTVVEKEAINQLDSEISLENVETTESLIFSYIDEVDTKLDRDRLKDEMKNIYDDALLIEDE